MAIDKLYIFDADATLRVCTVHDQPCPHAPGEWEVILWAKERLARIDWSRNGFGIVSNQAGVAKGYLSATMAGELLLELANAVTEGVDRTQKIRFCPHASDAGCECRKPKPKMILDVMAAFGADRTNTIYVGDLDTDRLAAEAAGVEFAWVWDFCERTREEWWNWLGERNNLHRREADKAIEKRARHPATARVVFVSGHLDLTPEEFTEHYAPRLLKAVDDGCSFVVGDARGADAMAQEFIAPFGVPAVVYHMHHVPRNNRENLPTRGGFRADEERDAAMTAASTEDIAWVRAGREKSGTAKNLRRRNGA
jgi:HAD superfamily hydrolase (TIGR01662 family)